MTDWDYDAGELVIQTSDGLNKATTFTYDALKRLTAATTPLSLNSSQGFDPDGNTKVLTNALSKTTQFAFDLGDRLKSVTTADAFATLFTYNTRNLAETITKPSGQKTTNTYNSASRLSQVADLFATSTFTYDKNGRITEVDDNAYAKSRKVKKTYDALGRLATYTDENGNLISYGYDQAGNLTLLTYPVGKTVAYTYDANNRLATVKDWAARLTRYAYDFNGRLVLTTFPNATIETRTYDLSGKLTTITDKDAKGNLIFSSLATMDSAGRILSEALSPAPTTAFSMPAATMTYDSDNRLKSYNGQLVSFDADGNMLTGPLPMAVGGSLFTFDPRNHLSQAAGSSYQYGPEGRRTSWTGSDGITRTFVIDPSGVLDRTLIRTKGATTTYYVYGLGLLYQEQATAYQQHHFDSRGSTVAITDNTGLVTDRFQYGPYGEPLGHTGSTDTPFQFNGRYGVQTDLNGLLYMRARYYDPTIRRFINQDSTLGSIALGITLNRFAFANGNPVSFMDPFGLCAQQNDPLQTRIANLAGGFINGITNTVLTAAQWISIVGGEPGAADFAQENMDVVARLGLYDSNSPIAQGAATLANNLVIDTFLFGGAESFSAGAPESGIEAESEDVVNLFHQGNLSNGVSESRALSTSTGSHLTHYNPSGKLYQFQVPRSLFNSWEDQGFILQRSDLYNGIITPEVRILPPASGQLNQFMMTP
jgi:RHS repeat-associated protein